MLRCPRCNSEIAPDQQFCGRCGAAATPSSEVGTVAMSGGMATRLSRTSTPQPERFPAGSVVAQRYRISGRIGKGGMGEVYKAYDLILEQDVALKFLPADVVASEETLERFRHEVRLARTVSHPNVCRVYDIGEIEGMPFLSMEYVDGEDLASLLRRIGRLPSDKALDIARRLCAGLSAAHEKGVLHRDLKPANIMLNGRGEVLITDFGLAAAGGSVKGPEARQGTPAYMAPEQLAGEEVTVRCDIYALGLVLYEIFTGKRAYEAESAAELMRLQAESTPRSITSIAKDADAAVESVIQRCLAHNPRDRPSSSRAVAAALPGGDPLEAALAAGETPSPELVAKAGETEGLRPAVAVSLMAGFLVCLGITLAAWHATSLFEKTPFEHSPEALATMAREHAKHFGYSERPRDSAVGIQGSTDYFDYARSHYTLARFWAQIANARPAPITFWYRQSPGPLDPGAQAERVSMDEPPLSVPGMLRMRLDMEGRLFTFEAVPPEREVAPVPSAAAVDWNILFTAAGLDPVHFQPSTPEWTPRMAFDNRAAWTGAWPEAPDVPIRIEAAAWRGKPVSFRVIEPWGVSSRSQLASARPALAILLWFVLFPIGSFLAWRNMRLKRGDRSGALRLAAAVFCLDFLSDILQMSHPAGVPEFGRLFLMFATDLTQGALVAVLYLALEPYVRRRQPRLLVSWTRLLHGGFRDPLVGRHVLIGLLAGFAVGLGLRLNELLEIRLGHVPSTFSTVELYANPAGILGARFLWGLIILSGYSALLFGMVILFVFFLLRTLLRRDWLAGAALALLAGISLAATVSPAEGELFAPVYVLIAFVLVRYGALALISIYLAPVLLNATALTLDPSRWYFGYSLTVLLVSVAIAVYAFRISLGGRPLIKEESLG